MESISCKACGSSRKEKLFSKKEKFGLTKQDFCVVSCLDCAFLYVDPRPTREEIPGFYPETYSWQEAGEEISLLSKLVNALEKFYRFHLLRYEAGKVLRFTGIKKGNVLDVGCGTGDRLVVFRERGFDAFGVEISSSAVYAKDKLKLKVVKGDIFDARYPNNSFDIVTLYNVLEHVHDPRKLLREIKRVLKKDGFLVLGVPNSDCLQYKIFKGRWAAFDLPRDLSYFNPKLLSGMLKTEGFEVRKIDHWTSWWHPPTFTLSLFPGLDPQFFWAKSCSPLKAISARLAWALVTVFVSPVFTFIESLLGRSAIISVYARKH
jgi:SAM-dependent methyltransferase